MRSWRLVATSALLAAGCSSELPLSGGGTPGIGGGPGGGSQAPTLACPVDQGDFSGFESWPRYLVGDGSGASPHINGVRYAYLNKAPPHGSTEFPLCTIIVKQTYPLDGGAPNPQLFAMVKQDDGYNDGGVPGWEWFELEEQYPNVFVILWGGSHPPPGCGYSPVTNGDAGVTGTTDCNACHSGGSENDYVLGSALDLSSF